ncbi:hypothetical protein APHAL10511_005796 [Amanita phalloides]|nr:hypothetical protein APHAL10511_005796 [Amanita phalloides]
MLKYSIHRDHSLNFTEGLLWDDELKEIEYKARTAPSEDADTYSHSLYQAELSGDELEEIVEAAIGDKEEMEGTEVEREEEDTDDNSSDGLYV